MKEDNYHPQHFNILNYSCEKFLLRHVRVYFLPNESPSALSGTGSTDPIRHLIHL
jgi:hypothetical protein